MGPLSFKWKRRFSFSVMFFYSFMSGVEYAIVFPTLWEYLQSLGIESSKTYWLGMCIAALSCSDMFVGFLAGRLADKFDRVSLMLMGFLAFAVVSAVLYLVARSPGWILASRVIGGIGNVATVSVMADICRSTTLEERTPLFVAINIAQQVGLLLGPAFNLVFRNFDFYIGPLHITKLNAPGLYMVIAYLLLEATAGLFYYDLARAVTQERERRRAAEQEQTDSEAPEAGPGGPGDAEEDEQLINPDVTWADYGNEVIRPEIIAILFLRFIAFVGQTALETIVTPLMYSYFGYDDFGSSLLYLAGGVWMLIVSVFIGFASKRVSDRSFILFGAVTFVFFYAFNLGVVPVIQSRSSSAVYYFATGAALTLFSTSIILDLAYALLSKLVKNEVQGFMAAVRRLVSNLGLIFGPLWGGAALPWLYVLFSVPLILVAIGLVLYILSYKDMVPTRPSPLARIEDPSGEIPSTSEAREERPDQQESDERTPLLA